MAEGVTTNQHDPDEGAEGPATEASTTAFRAGGRRLAPVNQIRVPEPGNKAGEASRGP